MAMNQPFVHLETQQRRGGGICGFTRKNVSSWIPQLSTGAIDVGHHAMHSVRCSAVIGWTPDQWNG